MQKIALITGSSGGIGQAMVDRFAADGFRVIGLDVHPSEQPPEYFVEADLVRFVDKATYRESVLSRILDLLPDGRLDALINNAALQVVKPTEELPLADWQRVLAANVTAPFALVQGLFRQLALAKGCVVNVSSIHANLTKPGFVAYATSKAALTGLTQALSVDVGDQFRVNGIAPAAVETPMLIAGFDANPEGLRQLAGYHPVKHLGKPAEIAKLASVLVSEELPFLNGSVVSIDGGIGNRLFDPV